VLKVEIIHYICKINERKYNNLPMTNRVVVRT
jgi:hypothetical protein